MENYIEHLVKRRDPGFYKPLKLLTAVLVIIAALSCFVSIFGLIFLGIAAGLAWYCFLNGNVEYEYLYIGGSLTVDRIMNRSRRKNVLDTTKDELICICPKKSSAADAAVREGVKLQDLSGNGAEEQKYLYLYQHGGSKQGVYLELTDKLLREMRMYTPQKIQNN